MDTQEAIRVNNVADVHSCRAEGSADGGGEELPAGVAEGGAGRRHVQRHPEDAQLCQEAGDRHTQELPYFNCVFYVL